MSARCPDCGLVNFAGMAVCKRCGHSLAGAEAVMVQSPAAAGRPKTPLRERLLRSAFRVLGLALLVLFLGYLSLITTSEPVVLEQRQTVERAIDVLERKGFQKEVFVLRRLVQYRKTDSWWNKRAGVTSAYAATNFPFEIVTLYPPFFEHPVDDVERALILLHESRHLFGYGEPRAYADAWREKARLGWTQKDYGATSVWNNVRNATMYYAPELFRCGPEGTDDCIE